MKKYLILPLIVFSACHAGSERLSEMDTGDVVEEVLDLFLPEVVGDIADKIIDEIDDRPVNEVFGEATEKALDFFGIGSDEDEK